MAKWEIGLLDISPCVSRVCCLPVSERDKKRVVDWQVSSLLLCHSSQINGTISVEISSTTQLGDNFSIWPLFIPSNRDFLWPSREHICYWEGGIAISLSFPLFLSRFSFRSHDDHFDSHTHSLGSLLGYTHFHPPSSNWSFYAQGLSWKRNPLDLWSFVLYDT